ncbi:hypothetical protein SCALM49S_00935 [Streptomyces californicus]
MRAGPSAVRTRVPSRASALAPEGFPIRTSRSSVNGSKPVTRTRFTRRSGNPTSRWPREAVSRAVSRVSRRWAFSANEGVHVRSSLLSARRAQYSGRSSPRLRSPAAGPRP